MTPFHIHFDVYRVIKPCFTDAFDKFTHMFDFLVDISFPYQISGKSKMSINYNSDIRSIKIRSFILFPSIDQNLSYSIFVLLTDGTYVCADEDNIISSFSIPKNPDICIVPDFSEVTYVFGVREPFSMKTSLKDDVIDIKNALSLLIGGTNPETFLFFVNGTVLVDHMNLPEQQPGIKEIFVIGVTDEKAKISFVDLYLRGPVFLSYTDSIHISSLLVQARLGPSRCFSSNISSLLKYIPERFQEKPESTYDLYVEWSTIRDISREEAKKYFVESVQTLPLFNCTSFSGSKCDIDKNSLLSAHFEIVFTEKRIFFLDVMKFKIRLSINFDDITMLKGHNPGVINLVYCDNEFQESSIAFKSPTQVSLIRKIIRSIVGNDPNAYEKYKIDNQVSFRTISQIRKDKQWKTGFKESYIYSFITLDEQDSQYSESDLMHSLLIRSESCAFHLNALVMSVTPGNAADLRAEVLEYFNRLLSYLKFLSIDHRPYDLAYDIGELLSNSDVDSVLVLSRLSNVLNSLTLLKKSFSLLSSDPLFISSKVLLATVCSHLFSYFELKSFIDDSLCEGFSSFVELFGSNYLSLKSLISKYQFLVGDLFLKSQLQSNLDTIIKHHLKSLNFWPIIIETVLFHSTNPSLIIHQDSLSVLVTSIVDFSNNLWEDRKQLSNEDMDSLFEESDSIVKSIISLASINNIVIQSIIDFKKIIEQKLPCLSGRSRMCYSMLIPVIRNLEIEFEKSPDFISCQTEYLLLKTAVIIISIDPLKFDNNVESLVLILHRFAFESYSQLLSDMSVFELNAFEGDDLELCTLLSYIQKNCNPLDEKGTLNQYFSQLVPIYAFQKNISRPLSNYSESFISLYFLYTICMNTLYSFSMKSINTDIDVTLINSENSNGSEVDFMKPCYSIDQIAERLSSLSPHDITPQTNHLIEIIKSEIINDPPIINIGPPISIRLLFDALYNISISQVRDVLSSINIDTLDLLISFQSSFISLVLFNILLEKLSFCGGFFEISSYLFVFKDIFGIIENKSHSLLIDYSPSYSFIEAYKSLYRNMLKLKNCHVSSSFMDMIQMKSIIITKEIESHPFFDGKIDLSSVLDNYRVIKNMLIESIINKKENDFIFWADQIHSLLELLISYLGFYINDSSIHQSLSQIYCTFVSKLNRTWHLNISSHSIMNIFDDLENMNNYIIDLLTNRMFEEASIDSINHLIHYILEHVYTPKGRSSFIINYCSEVLERLQADLPDSLFANIYEALLLLMENNISALRDISSTISEKLSKIVLESDYCIQCIEIEDTIDIIISSNIFIWFKESIKDVCIILKSNDFNHSIIECVKILRKDFNATIGPNRESILIILTNLSTAIQKYHDTRIENLNQIALSMPSNFDKIESLYEQFVTTALQNVDFSPVSLVYKDSILLLVSEFFDEYIIQGWDSRDFQLFIEICSDPFVSGFGAQVLSKTIKLLRSTLRELRNIKLSVRPRFVTEVETIINSFERNLKESLQLSEKKVDLNIKKQRLVLNEYIEKLNSLPNTQIKSFILRIIENIGNSLSSFNIIEADSLSRNILKLFESLESTYEKTEQINTLVTWLHSIEQSAFVSDISGIFNILNSIIVQLMQDNDHLLLYEEYSLIEISIDLSKTAEKASAIRNSIYHIRTNNPLKTIKSDLLLFMEETIRTIEIYVDQIHMFTKNPSRIVDFINYTTPVCNQIEYLVNSSFNELIDIIPIISNTINVLRSYLSSCSEDTKEIVFEVTNSTINKLLLVTNEK